MANCGLLLNDGSSFLLLNDSSFVLLNDNSCSAEPGATAAATAAVSVGGAGGYATAWRQYWEDNPATPYLQPEAELEEYKRLLRKLRMLEEHLLEAKGRQIDVIERKIADIRERMQELEW